MRRQIVEEERQRLLQEHASKLVGFLPKVCTVGLSLFVCINICPRVCMTILARVCVSLVLPSLVVADSVQGVFRSERDLEGMPEDVRATFRPAVYDDDDY
jgi:hypothetical protein